MLLPFLLQFTSSKRSRIAVQWNGGLKKQHNFEMPSAANFRFHNLFLAGSKPFDTSILFLKFICEKVNFEKSSRREQIMKVTQYDKS